MKSFILLILISFFTSPVKAGNIELAEIQLVMKHERGSCLSSNKELRDLMQVYDVGALDDGLFRRRASDDSCIANFMLIGESQNMNAFEMTLKNSSNFSEIQRDAIKLDEFSMITTVFPRRGETESSQIFRYSFQTNEELYLWAKTLRGSLKTSERLKLIKDKMDPSFYRGFEIYYDDYGCVPGITILLFSIHPMGKVTNLREVCD